MTRHFAWFAFLLLIGGCVTTETGGPKAATKQQKVQAYLELARGYLEKRDFTNARRPLDQALRVDPSSAEAHVLMASVYVANGDTQLAEREYKDALRYEPKNAMAQNNYGTFLFAAERYKEAVQHLKIAANDTTYGRRGQAYENLGLTQLKLNEPADAEQSFQRALMFNIQQPRSNLELADLYFKSGDFVRCKQYFDAYNTLARPSARSLWLGVRLSRVLSDQDQLSSYALALKNLFPDSPEYRLYQERSW
jgi:type IV pilus assembly protein PilF